MALERERRFLLKEEFRDEAIKMCDPVKVLHINQAYLMFEGRRHLRIRIQDNPFLLKDEHEKSKRAFLAYKNVFSKTDRDEYEFEVPFVKGLELFSTVHEDMIVSKWRYHGTFNSKEFCIDVFIPSNIAIVEIEYDESEDFMNMPVPYFCGEEVTGNPEYTNLGIARRSKSFTS